MTKADPHFKTKYSVIFETIIEGIWSVVVRNK